MEKNYYNNCDNIIAEKNYGWLGNENWKTVALWGICFAIILLIVWAFRSWYKDDLTSNLDYTKEDKKVYDKIFYNKK